MDKYKRQNKTEKQRKEELKQKLAAEEHRATAAYYPPNPQYKPPYEEDPLTLVRNLPLGPTQEGPSDCSGTEEEKRKMLELLNEEFDLDYYSELDSDSDTDYRYPMLL